MKQDQQAAQPYETLEVEGVAEVIVERSRFLGWAAPVASIDEALARVAALRREHYDARHVCFGARVGRGEALIDRFNDDGEPTRTGGYPMWQLLEGEGLTDVVVIAVRYFGGIKLGTGGLARAYRDCAREALADAVRVVRWPEGQLVLECAYGQLGALDHLLAHEEAARVVDRAWGASVVTTLAVRQLEAPRVLQQIAGLLQRDVAALAWTTEAP